MLSSLQPDAATVSSELFGEFHSPLLISATFTRSHYSDSVCRSTGHVQNHHKLLGERSQLHSRERRAKPRSCDHSQGMRTDEEEAIRAAQARHNLSVSACISLQESDRHLQNRNSCFLDCNSYQTIQLCQPCSQKLTPREKETPVAAKNGEERVAEVPVAPKPPDKPSAHSLFWGKVARREVKIKGGAAAPKVRPFSADIPRVRFQKSASKSTHSSRQLHRQLSQLPPVVAQISTPSAQPEGTPQDLVENIVQHLQRKYHRPSIRFALAQCNIFPSSSVIPVSVLMRICTPELATAILKHVSEHALLIPAVEIY